MPTPARTSIEEILKAGRAIIETDGIDGLTMQAIADRVGVRAPSLYKRIRSRNQLLRLVTQLQGCSDRTNILPHPCQIPCLKGQHRRWGLKACREPVSLPVADCTDLAEILGDDKIGLQLLERRCIYGGDRLP